LSIGSRRTCCTRGHLKQVFAKTDTRRQAELVRPLLTGMILIQPWF
jgi:hypothetical protein